MKILALVLLHAVVTTSLSSRRLPSSVVPTVNVKNGTISGLHLSTYNQDLFLGVPFAQPPVDELRFRNPQSINSSYDTTIEATEYAPMCVGYGVSIHRLYTIVLS